jgi:transposase
MPIASIYDSEPWPMSLREDSERQRATSFRSGGIRCIAGSGSSRPRGHLRRKRGENMPPVNWTMPWWRSTLPTIPTRPWRNWGSDLLSARWRFGKPATGCGLPEKKTLRYVERDEPARGRFQDELDALEPKNLVYLDESGVDAALHRPYARAPRGMKVLGEVSGTHAQRISLIAALHESRLLAPMRFEGYCDTLVFNAWLEQVLLPELRPGQTVLMDNASFHKSPTTKTLIESKGCTLKYLPTYSPDLNPIEPQWAILKARLRKHKTAHQSLGKAIDAIFAMY